MATVKSDRSQLGDLLVEMGLVDREQMSLALAQHRMTGVRLARILAERRLVDEDRLAKAISAKLGLEAVNLASLKIHERVLAIIPANVALKYGALPIAIKRTNQAEFVYVVMADPLDGEALAELQRVSGRQIRVLVGTASELDRALEAHYRSALNIPRPPGEAQNAPPPSQPQVPQKPSSSPPAAIPSSPSQPFGTKTDLGRRGLGQLHPSPPGGTPAQVPPQPAQQQQHAPQPHAQQQHAQPPPPPQPDRKTRTGPPPIPGGGFTSTTPPPIAAERRTSKAMPTVPTPAPSALPPLPQSNVPPQAAPRGTQPRAPLPPLTPTPAARMSATAGRSEALPLPREASRDFPGRELQSRDVPASRDAVPRDLQSRDLPPPILPQPPRPLPPAPPANDPLPRETDEQRRNRVWGAPATGSSPVPSRSGASAPSRATPSGGTQLPGARQSAKDREPLRDTLYDTPPSFLGVPSREAQREAAPREAPREAPRVPSAEEDRTSFDPAVPFALETTDEAIDRPRQTPLAAPSPAPAPLGSGEWDLAVRDWDQGPSGSWPEGGALPVASPADLSMPAAQQQDRAGDANEPVTSEGSLRELGEPGQPGQEISVSQTPTSRPLGADPEEVHIEILDATDGADEMKTSQVELTEDNAAQILRVDAVDESPPPPPPPPRVDRQKMIALLELPMDFADGPSPFEGPESADIPVGLERTGIIPAIDWEKEEFIPPPLARPSAASSASLIGFGDIPLSQAAVRARQEADVEMLEEITIEPPPERATPKPELRPAIVEDREPLHVPEPPKKRRSDPPQRAIEEEPRPEPESSLPEVEPEPLPELDAQAELFADPAPARSGSLAIADDSDSRPMPVIEPSSLVSLMDDEATAHVEVTGHDEGVPYPVQEEPVASIELPEAAIMEAEPAPRALDENDREKPARTSATEEDPTNPRIDKHSVTAALAQPLVADEAPDMRVDQTPLSEAEVTPAGGGDAIEREKVLAELGGMLVVASRDAQRETMEIVRTPSRSEDDARRMIAALMMADSLTSADRAQLVLAIGRLLLRKGLIGQDELMEELRK